MTRRPSSTYQLLLVSLFVLFIFACSSFAALQRKQLSGPPSEFASKEIPIPVMNAQTDTSFMVTTQSALNSHGEAEAVVTFPVDSHQAFSFAPYSTYSYKLKLYNPLGIEVPFLSLRAQPNNIQIGEDLLESYSYYFRFPLTGVYTLKITFDTDDWKNQTSTTTTPDVVVFVWNDSPVEIFTRLQSYSSTQGSQIGLVSQLYDASQFDQTHYRTVLKQHPPALKWWSKKENDLSAESVSVTLTMVSPSGAVTQVQMHDDGMHEDLDSDDGVYGGQITAAEDGTYIAQAKFSGTLPDGRYFERSTQQLMAVVSASITLDGSAFANVSDPQSDWIEISLGVKNEKTPTTYRAYAEVSSVDGDGNVVPVCWISSLVNTQMASDGQLVVNLQLNKRWLTYSNVTTDVRAILNSLTLNNVSLQDVETYIVLSYYSEMSVTFLNNAFADVPRLLLSKEQQMNPLHISEEMRKGKRPSKYQRRATPLSAESSGVVMLVHGYCSKSNPWTAYASDWTNALFFLSAESNDENDEFAQKVEAFAEQQGVSSYSAVGYSQGGMVITHLYNYYWSGLDLPTNGRLLQSVVTPYGGSGAAGNIAIIGRILGIGCGSVTDLTHDGSSLWLSGISDDVKASVYFYYVQYPTTQSKAYCNSGANTFLKKPNDGVTEVAYAILSGANNMGVTVGQCHGNNMQYTPAFADSTRNSEMNAAAAR